MLNICLSPDCDVDWAATGSMLSAYALLIAAGIATIGLFSWRSQLRLQARHRVSLNLLSLTNNTRLLVAEGLMYPPWSAELKPDVSEHQSLEAFPDQGEYAWWELRYRCASQFLKAMHNSRDLWAQLMSAESQASVVLQGTEHEPAAELIELRRELMEQAATIIRNFNTRLYSGEYDQQEFDLVAEKFPYNATNDEAWPIEDIEKSIHPEISDRLKKISEELESKLAKHFR